MSEWRDISTAPVDGTAILIKVAAGVVEAWYDKPRHTPSYEDPDDWTGNQWVALDDTLQFESGEPTHWMPLPDPPKDAGP